MMEKEHRVLLQKNNHYISINLDINRNLKILNYLLDKKVLSNEHVEEINELSSNFQKIDKLLSILPRRGKKAFDFFLEALRDSDQNDICNNLLECLGKDIPDGPEENNNAQSNGDRGGFEEIIAVPEYTCIIKKMILIININKIKGIADERIGSDKDIEGLNDFFVKKRKYELFRGKIFNDQKSCELVSLIMEFATYLEKRKDGHAVVVIMSHGNDRGVLTNDNQVVNIRRILECFLQGEDSPFITFIFNFCRGSKPLNLPENKCEIISRQGACCVTDLLFEDRGNDVYLNFIHAPPRSIVAYSTQKYFISRRYEEGTIFIQSMLKVFEENYQNLSLREMLMKVKSRMRQDYPDDEQFPDIKEHKPGHFLL